MLLKRETHIGATRYQRGADLNGYANGFKPRTFQTGIGVLGLSIPSTAPDRIEIVSLFAEIG
jgi:hypothetical protein